MNHFMKLTATLAKRLGCVKAMAGLLVAGSAALSLGPNPASAQTPAHTESPAHSEVAQAVAALRGISTMRADFVQRSESTGQQISGVFSLKRPGKIRFQYQAGYPVQILSDGRALTIVDTAVGQTQRWPIGNSPLGALLDPGKDVARYGTVLPAFAPNIVNIRVEDRSHPEYGSMLLVFARKPSAPGGLELTGWQSLDAQNQRTNVRLSNQQYGVPLSDELFRFLDTRARPHK